MNFRFGLRGKFVAALVLVALAALSLAALFAARAVDHIREELGVAYTRDLTLLKQARITAPLTRDLALALRMADSEPIRQWLLDEQNPEKRASAMREVEGYRAAFESRAAFVISALSHNYYFNSPRAPFSDRPNYTLDPEHKPDDAWFPSVLAMSTAYDTNVSYDTELHVSSVWINVLMRAGEQRLGLVGTGLELTRFLDAFIADTQAGVTPVIVNAEGAILAHPDRARISNQAATRSVPPEHQLWALVDAGESADSARKALAQAQAHPGGAVPIKLTVQGRQVLFAASYIPDLQWFVLSIVDLGTAQVLDGRQLWQFALAAGALFLIAALLIAWVVNHLVVAPLIALKNSAQTIAAGNYALSLQASGGDEIGELGVAFAAMVDKVRRHTEELESTVRERTAELVAANTTMAQANAKIADSIAYASRIQQAMLPVQALARALGGRHYLLWRPRDVVGGDFYLFHTTDRGFLIGVVDCAGHGVPGALMTMLGNAALDRAIAEVGAADPAGILRVADRALRALLHVGDRVRGTATSMDVGLAYVDTDASRLHFAGAKVELLIAGAQGATRLPGARRALADRVPGEFENVGVDLDPAVTYLLTSDGLLDQNGERDALGFGRARVQALLQQYASSPLAEFGQALEAQLEAYQGGVAQRDDICVLAFRIGPLPPADHPNRVG
ncbi:MAG: SpoIIE family protein phosphatase [Xanthomonadales bacterium]|nr:hypothetical protein [Xanthomonadales bacterium]MCC6591822.1 SpoIIE family protein phosphatase [Xanthomonadales bacterium]MCE7931446.1 HAMP domain-containing protein [Xanthomonadales bacterium PRO6]